MICPNRQIRLRGFGVFGCFPLLTKSAIHCKIRQDLNIASAAFAGSFPAILRFEKPEIHKVFLHFPNLVLQQTLSPNALAEFCGIA